MNIINHKNNLGVKMSQRIKYGIVAATIAAALPMAALAVAAGPSVLSDFARDVQEGKSQLASDPLAQKSHDEVGASEDQTGNVDDGEVNVDKDVVENESTQPEEHDGSESKDSANSGGENSNRSSGHADNGASTSGDNN